MSVIIDDNLLVKDKRGSYWNCEDEKHLDKYLLEWKLIDNLEYVEALDKLQKLKGE